MLKLTQEEEISGSKVEKNKEVGHHRNIKKIETSRGTRDHMIGGYREDSTENRMYRSTTESNRNAETKKMYNKQSKSSENSQRLWPAVVARGGYTQIVVNPMQLEDKAFTAWMQRLTEARRNRENRVLRPYRNFPKHYNDKYEPLKESGKDRYGKY